MKTANLSSWSNWSDRSSGCHLSSRHGCLQLFPATAHTAWCLHLPSAPIRKRELGCVATLSGVHWCECYNSQRVVCRPAVLAIFGAACHAETISCDSCSASSADDAMLGAKHYRCSSCSCLVLCPCRIACESHPSYVCIHSCRAPFARGTANISPRTPLQPLLLLLLYLIHHASLDVRRARDPRRQTRHQPTTHPSHP